MNNYSENVIKAMLDGIVAGIPETALTISDWAAKYRVIPAERVADSALAGKWRNETTPYMVEPMNAVTDSKVNEVVFMKSAQVGGTELLNNILGYYVHIDPATILYLCENEGKARAWSVECLAPLIRDTPALHRIFGEAKQRDSTNMIESKGFRGGHFALAWSTSPATLSSRPRRIILADEIDAFEPTKEGDPLKLAEARTKTAGANRKIIMVSTPRFEETSQVSQKFHESTAEKYFVPCPHCEEMQILTWRNEEGQRHIQWEFDSLETTLYFCHECGEGIEELDKEWMLANGAWRSTNPDYEGNRRGFWINELYSPWSSWADMAAAYIDCGNSKGKLQVFTNTRLAETWQIEGDKLDILDLAYRQEEYGAEIPPGVLVLTAGVDIQGDRVEIEVVGWGEQYESWSIDYRVIYGDPTDSEDGIWEDLFDYLTRDFYDSKQNVWNIKATGIDSGYQADNIYAFCKPNVGRRFFVFKGANQPKKALISKPSRNNRYGVAIYTIGVNTAKDKVYNDLTNSEPGPGYCHFPEDREAGYFQQFANEHRVKRFVSGQPVYRWEKVSDHARNEALDLRVYALAAAKILNPDFRTLRKKLNLSKSTDEKEMTPKKNEPAETPKMKPEKKTNFFRRNKGKNFTKGWR